MTTSTVHISFHRDVATNKLTMLDKLSVIKQVRDVTFGNLKATKDLVDAFELAVISSVPRDDVLRNKIVGAINALSGNDLLDILKFVDVTRVGASAHVGSFNEEGDYIPVDKQYEYHSCGDECRHQCEHAGCDRMISYHDEPFCFTHSPDEGSSVKGYDSRNNRSF